MFLFKVVHHLLIDDEVERRRTLEHRMDTVWLPESSDKEHFTFFWKVPRNHLGAFNTAGISSHTGPYPQGHRLLFHYSLPFDYLV